MFDSTTFLVVASDTLCDEEIDTLVSSLNENHATVIIKKETENENNYLHTHAIDHIITLSTEFIEYEEAHRAMIPISTPQWVYDSLLLQRHLSSKTYNPDPKFFMRDCFVCVADNLPAGDKEAIYAGVRAFGGLYLDVLTKYTTHLIAKDMTNEKSIIASSAISTEDEKIDIKIVVPHWIDHCLSVGRKLDVTPYLLPNPTIFKGKDIPGSQISLMDKHEDLLGTHLGAKFLEGKKFYILSDFNLSERLTQALKKMIESAGGFGSDTFDSLVDVYIGKYRSGEAYKSACTSDRIIVGNLHWLYSILLTGTWILPQNSNVLHYPVPDSPLASFKGVNISITNYSGDARTYLSKLITILGGKFTKTLTRDNEFLISARPEGKKWETATNKWVDANGKPIVKVVNHLWLEECYAKWTMIDPDSKESYKFFGRDMNGIEMLLGRTKLLNSDLKRWYAPESPQDVDIDDSMSDDGSIHTAKSPMISQSTLQKVQELRYGSRSAAKRAAEKLHDNMSDLNAYKEIAKSLRKMKTYMEELEGKAKAESMKRKEEAATSPTAKKLKANHENILESTLNNKPPTREASPLATAAKKSPEFTTIAIMTGCEKEITLSKADVNKLAQTGIKILSDYSAKYVVNTLIAPKILRTEKFLRSLVHAKMVIHPNYLVELLKRINEVGADNAGKEFKIEDYSLDKVRTIKEINAELGSTQLGNALASLLSSKNKGKLFENTPLNISANIRGGHALITGILTDHGMKNYSIVKPKATSTTLKKQVVKSDDGKIILICNKAQDGELIKTFKAWVKENKLDGIAIEWDWCVKLIFAMKLERFEAFKI